MVSVLVTELYALKNGLLFALDASLLPLIIESDCLNAVLMINGKEDCLAPEGRLVEEIRMLLQQRPPIVVCYLPRQAKTVAHRIANYGLRERDLAYSMELLDCVHIDCIFIFSFGVSILIGMCGTFS